MGVIVQMEAWRRHGRASAGTAKAPMGTAPPVSSLKRLASPKEGSRFPLKINDRYGSEHPTLRAILACELLASIQTFIGCTESLMPQNLSNGKDFARGSPFLPANSLWITSGPCLGMTDRAHDDEGFPIYLDEWMTALSKRNVDLAEHLGVSESAVSNWRRGKKPISQVSKLRRIAAFLEMPAGSLFVQPPPREMIDATAKSRGETLAALADFFQQARPGHSQDMQSGKQRPRPRRAG